MTNDFRPPSLPAFGLCVLLAVFGTACARVQKVDGRFRPVLPNPPTYLAGQGPELWIDEAHFNIVSLNGRYRPLMAVLRADGYQLRPHRSRFAPGTLFGIKILIIGNPLPGPEDESFYSPSQPAFEEAEVKAVADWVRDGGRLLLLLDHMPIAGAGAGLARELGFEFSDGIVINWETWEPTLFQRTDNTLLDHPITRGRSPSERISKAAAFYGAAFRAADARPILVIPAGFDSFLPKIAWEIDKSTRRIQVRGWFMGASREIGRGKVVLFSDATMFSAQILPDGNLMGMNAPLGRENLQLLLNALHWLDDSTAPGS